MNAVGIAGLEFNYLTIVYQMGVSLLFLIYRLTELAATKMYNCTFHVSVKQHITLLLITLKPFYGYKGGSHPTALLCDTLCLSNQSTRKIIKTHV